jgi:hypothetical protein
VEGLSPVGGAVPRGDKPAPKRVCADTAFLHCTEGIHGLSPTCVCVRARVCVPACVRLCLRAARTRR